MKRKHDISRRSLLRLAALAAMAADGTSSTASSQAALSSVAAGPQIRPVIKALHASTPVKIDGYLREPLWKDATAYKLIAMPIHNEPGRRKVLHEGGTLRMLWDEHYLYLGAELVDSDVVTECTGDGLADFQLGDVCELFIWPPNETWYWELYVTPNSRQTTYFFPGPGRLGLPGNLRAKTNLLKVAAQVHGTLNNWHDRDRGWTAEMAVPISMLTARGEHFGPKAPSWRILIGRYNYSRYLPEVELSSFPELSKTNFHLLAEYCNLELVFN